MPYYVITPPVSKGLTFDEAQGLIRWMAATFQVSTPNLVWTCSRRGRYVISTGTIRVGRNSWRGIHSVIHEFAHHLDVQRNGGAQQVLYKYRTIRKRMDFHGHTFVKALEDCVDAVFGDQTMYAWDAEYIRVKRLHHLKQNMTVPRAQSTIQFDSLAMAAEPIEKSSKRVEAARRAWAKPSEENGWLGGHLWRRKHEE